MYSFTRFFFIINFFFLSYSIGWANCFTTHLEEAIEINKSRIEAYAELSNNRSRSISNKLIIAEKLTTIFAKLYDKRAAIYRENGIPLFCDDFVSMNLIPEFRDRDLSPDPLTKYKKINISIMQIKLRWAFYTKGFAGLEAKALSYYQWLDETKTYHSMLKHILESIVNSARLAPTYIQMSKAQDLEPPRITIWSFLEGFISALRFASILDREAAPLQEQGLLIITQDIPKILHD